MTVGLSKRKNAKREKDGCKEKCAHALMPFSPPWLRQECEDATGQEEGREAAAEQHEDDHHRPLIPSNSVTACSKGAGVSFLVKTSPLWRSEAWYSKTKLESSAKNCS